MTEQDQRKSNYLNALRDTHSVQVYTLEEEPVTLRNGTRSRIYIEHAILANHTQGFRTFVDAMGGLLQEQFADQPYVLSNVDSRVSPQIVGALSYSLDMPQLIYKSPELTSLEKGMGTQITGKVAHESAIAVVDDVMTAGDATALDVAEVLFDTFPFNEIEIFVGVNRTKESAIFSDNGVVYPLHAVATLDDVIKHTWSSLSEKQKEALR